MTHARQPIPPHTRIVVPADMWWHPYYNATDQGAPLLPHGGHERVQVDRLVCVCVCVCARARARICPSVCVCMTA